MFSEQKRALRKKKRDHGNRKINEKQHLAIICWTVGFGVVEAATRIFSQYERPLSSILMFIIVAVFFNIPATFLEIGLAQYSRRGPMKIWDAAPVWRGIGISAVICNIIICMKAFPLTVYFLVYTLNGLKALLPWVDCTDQSFQNFGCYTYGTNRSVHEMCIQKFSREHCDKIEWYHSAEVFLKIVTQRNFGEIPMEYSAELIVCSLLTLLAAYICIRNSMYSMSVYLPFLVYVPSVLHAILLVKTFTHPGSRLTVKSLFSFSFEDFGNLEIWIDMLIYSLIAQGNNMGGLQKIGSHQHFRNPTNLQAVMINLISTTYSILYVVLFQNMNGIFAFETKDQFISKPHYNLVWAPLTLTIFNLEKFYTFCFLFSNFVILLRNFIIRLDVILAALYETGKKFKRYHNTSSFVACFIFFMMFLVIKCSDSADIIIDQLATYTVMTVSPISAFYTTIFICFFYGVQRYIDDVQFMLGFRITIIWEISWYLSNFVYLLCFVFVFSYFFLTIQEDEIPLLTISTFLSALPILYFITLVVVKWQKKSSIIAILKPTKDWGPHEEILKRSRDMFSAQDMTKEYLYRQQRLKQNISMAGSSSGAASRLFV